MNITLIHSSSDVAAATAARGGGELEHGVIVAFCTGTCDSIVVLVKHFGK